MNLNNISFPYPVLGISDDVFPLLKENCIQMVPSSTSTTFYFDITLKQENADISSLINRDYAEYVCEVNCPRTYYRKCFASKSAQMHIEIPKKLLAREVSFTCLVVAKRNIWRYTNKGFYPDYQGFYFDMGIGDVLVAFGKAVYSIDINYDKLQSAGSFMYVRENVKGKENVSFNVADDKIEILLPTDLYDVYKNRFGQDAGVSEIFHSSFVLNALTYALQYIEDYPNTLWARTLKYRMNTEELLQGYDISDKNTHQDLAQVLLGNPYKRMFERLQKIKNSEEVGDVTESF